MTYHAYIAYVESHIVAQLRYIKIQPKTIDLRRGSNNYRVYGVYSPEPSAEVYFALNFNISKLGYYIA